MGVLLDRWAKCQKMANSLSERVRKEGVGGDQCQSLNRGKANVVIEKRNVVEK